MRIGVMVPFPGCLLDLALWQWDKITGTYDETGEKGCCSGYAITPSSSLWDNSASPVTPSILLIHPGEAPVHFQVLLAAGSLWNKLRCSGENSSPQEGLRRWLWATALGVPFFTTHHPPAQSHIATPRHQLPHDLTSHGIACSSLEISSASLYKSTSAVGCIADPSLLQTLWTEKTQKKCWSCPKAPATLHGAQRMAGRSPLWPGCGHHALALSRTCAATGTSWPGQQSRLCWGKYVWQSITAYNASSAFHFSLGNRESNSCQYLITSPATALLSKHNCFMFITCRNINLQLLA